MVKFYLRDDCNSARLQREGATIELLDGVLPQSNRMSTVARLSGILLLLVTRVAVTCGYIPGVSCHRML